MRSQASLTSIVALVAVRIASKPANANHPFGHHKVEYFSVLPTVGLMKMLEADRDQFILRQVGMFAAAQCNAGHPT